MKVLMVSKFAGLQGGVERHIIDLRRALMDRGVDTDIFSSETVASAGGRVFDKKSARSGRVAATKDILWNLDASRAFASYLAEFRPDVVHFHSIYHQLSPSVLNVFRGPKVMTLHDYKLVAPCYSLYRDGTVCTDCVGKSVKLPAIQYKCISGSRLASAVCVTEDALHHGRYVRSIDQFVVPSPYLHQLSLRSGVPKEKLNVVRWGSQPAARVSAQGRHPGRAVFLGRLHPTKGVAELLNAWRKARRPGSSELHIAGDGELRPLVEAVAATDPSVRYHGKLDRTEVDTLLASADFGIVPSTFPETMGLSALEFLVSGVPLIVSDRGALADLNGPGVMVCGMESIGDLVSAIEALLDGQSADAMRAELSHRDLSSFSVEAMARNMIEVYSRSMADHTT